MQRSVDRILTTHAGSLNRDAELAELLIDREQGRELDRHALGQAIAGNIERVVAKQIESGVDVGNDGEMPRVGFSTYVQSRMSGFGGESRRNDIVDFIRFPAYRELYVHRYHATTPKSAKKWNAPQAVADVCYDEDMTEVKAECDAFLAALDRHRDGFAETFMTAVSPGNMTCTMLNAHYATEQDYLMAAARELKKEYDYIHARGFVVQIDAPDLALERQLYFQKRPHEDFIDGVRRHVAAINHAVADIPPERIRLHVCWGNYEGPHSGDVALEDILPHLYEARVGALSIAFANPRHQHEYRAFARYPLPDSMVLIAGVIDVTTNYLEHAQVVADRVCQAVDAVGDKTRVIAGTDCGFSTFAGSPIVADDVCWAKLAALREGADIATRRLWR